MTPEVDRLTGLVPDLINASRKIGLYVEGTQVVAERELAKGPALIIEMVVGDVAFADRVQDPDQDHFDDIFREMAATTLDNDFLDTKSEIARRIRAGLDPLD